MNVHKILKNRDGSNADDKKLSEQELSTILNDLNKIVEGQGIVAKIGDYDDEDGLGDGEMDGGSHASNNDW